MKLYLKYEWDEDSKSFLVAKGESQHKLELNRDSRKTIREIVEDISRNSGIKSNFNMILCMVFWVLFVLLYVVFFVVLMSKPTSFSVSVFSPDVALNTTTANTTNTTGTSGTQTGYSTYSRVDVTSFGANNKFGIGLMGVTPFILFTILGFTFTRKTRQQLVREYLVKQDEKYKKMLDVYNMALGVYFFEIEDDDDESNKEDEVPVKKSGKAGTKPQKKRRSCVGGKLMVGALEFFDKGDPKSIKNKRNNQTKEASKAQKEVTQPDVIIEDQIGIQVDQRLPGALADTAWQKSAPLWDGIPILPSSMRTAPTTKQTVDTSAPQPIAAPRIPFITSPDFQDYPLESSRSNNALLFSQTVTSIPTYPNTNRALLQSGISPSSSRRKRF